jgi:hypothetical protein
MERHLRENSLQATMGGTVATIRGRQWEARRAIAWALAAIAIHGLFLTLVAAANGWSLQPLIEIHDGIYYTSHLRDPLLIDAPEWWDNVPYRAIRVGYVLLALPFRFLGAVPALVIVNLLAMGVGAVVIREIAIRHGASRVLAWSIWVANPGALVGTALLLPDTVAWVAILLTLVFIDDDRIGWAIGFGLLAVITKESSLVAIALAGLTRARQGDRRALIPAMVAAAGHLSLFTLLVLRFGGTAYANFLSWPMTGWFGAASRWIQRGPLSLSLGLLTLTGSVYVIAIWWRRRSFYLGAAVGHAVLTVFLAPVVLGPMANTSRIGGLYWPLLAATRESGQGGRIGDQAPRSAAHIDYLVPRRRPKKVPG